MGEKYNAFQAAFHAASGINQMNFNFILINVLRELYSPCRLNNQGQSET
jgi:hypothetical protein